MDLRHLRYFVTVAEELHFGRAAKKLHISQPPLSQQIRRLEAEVGAPLLERNQRRVKLTPVGEAFYRRARMILAAAQMALLEARQVAAGEQETLTLGFMSAVMLVDFPPFLQALRERLPQVRVAFRQNLSDSQYEALLDGRIDAGFVDLAVGRLHPRFSHDRIHAQLALRKRLVVALPPAHPLAGRSRVSLGDLATEPFVTLPRQTFPSFYDSVIELCQRARFSPRIEIEAEQMPTVLAYTAAGYGVSIVPDSSRSWTRDIAFVDLDEVAHVDIWMITRAEQPVPAAVECLRAVVAAQVEPTALRRLRAGGRPRRR